MHVIHLYVLIERIISLVVSIGYLAQMFRSNRHLSRLTVYIRKDTVHTAKVG